MNTVFLTYSVLCGLIKYIHQCVFNSLVASTFDGRVELSGRVSDSPCDTLCKLMDNAVHFRSLSTKLGNDLNRLANLYENRNESILQRPREKIIRVNSDSPVVRVLFRNLLCFCVQSVASLASIVWNMNRT